MTSRGASAGAHGRPLIIESAPACYVDGIIVAIGEVLEGCPRYRIRVARRVWDGREVAGEQEVFPPVNGTPSLLGMTNGVVKLYPHIGTWITGEDSDRISRDGP